jgi:hypothetical protein
MQDGCLQVFSQFMCKILESIMDIWNGQFHDMRLREDFGSTFQQVIEGFRNFIKQERI